MELSERNEDSAMAKNPVQFHEAQSLSEFKDGFNRRYTLEEMIPRLGYVAVRSPPMPMRLLTMAEAPW
jgi:hypothetical protein